MKFKADGDMAKCLDGAANCWGGLSPSSGVCDYKAANTYIPGSATKYDSGSDTVDGYFLNGTSFE